MLPITLCHSMVQNKILFNRYMKTLKAALIPSTYKYTKLFFFLCRLHLYIDKLLPCTFVPRMSSVPGTWSKYSMYICTLQIFICVLVYQGTWTAYQWFLNIFCVPPNDFCVPVYQAVFFHVHVYTRGRYSGALHLPLHITDRIWFLFKLLTNDPTFLSPNFSRMILTNYQFERFL